MRITLSILSTLFFGLVIFAQKTLDIHPNGELSKKNYEKLVKSRSYQAISSFDTISLNPLLIYAIYAKDGKLGILDHTGKEVTAALYERIAGLELHPVFGDQRFHDHFIVIQNDKYGMMNNTGKIILPTEYYSIDYGEYSSDRYFKDEYFVSREERGEVYYNTQGKEIQKPQKNGELKKPPTISAPTPIPDKPLPNDNPFGTVSQRIGNFAIVTNQVDGKTYYGAVDLEKQKLIVPIAFNYVTYDRFQRFMGGNYGEVKNYALYDSEGKELLYGYEKIEEINGVYFITKDKKIAVYDENLNPITDFLFDYAFHYKGHILASQNKLYGMIDQNGKELLPFEFEELNFVYYKVGSSHDLNPPIRAKKNKKEGLLDFDGNVLIPIEYDRIDTQIAARQKTRYPYGGRGEMMPVAETITENNAYFVVRNNWKYGVIDRDYKLIVATEFDEVLRAEKSPFIHLITKDEKNRRKEGLYQFDVQKYLFEPTLDADFSFLNGKYIVEKRKDEYAMFDLQGNQIIPFQDRSIDGFNKIYKGLIKIYSYGKPKNAILFIDQGSHPKKFYETDFL